MKLYVYDHCPYCVRARMIFGLKKVSYELKIILNDDEKTPISMVGKKVVPILEKDDGSYMPESMDIVHYVDDFYPPKLLTGKSSAEIMELVELLDDNAFRQLVTPRFISLGLPEFATAGAISYFTEKKQQSLGKFADCLAKTATLCDEIQTILVKLDAKLVGMVSDQRELSTDDIQLFPLLRNLSIVKELKFPENVKRYMQWMSQKSGVDLYFDRSI
ncbi:glutaredoxin 2 [Zophobihabitans entericus]|uniref:Glutaredoxin 2 n=1 Tax=Zophobihabitans entericus TaxID=1635327 RepID=A0A6G9IA12_9GAMM|nr:glutaredoxin 2 [Zophobihabitans entericus]QIQ21056.1 glutaredoxin 2 [Zophobihabitans entericus]